MKLIRRILLLSALSMAVSTMTLVAQVNPLVDLLAQDGWKALAAGQAAAAAKIFQQALAIDANNPELYLGAGTAAYLDRRDEAAQIALERALQLNPALPLAREVLGLVQYRRGDLFGAIRTYEPIDRSQPQNQQAIERLERWRHELDLHNRMDTMVSSAFTVSFEGEANTELAALALASLERAVDRIGQVLSTYPDKQIRSCSIRPNNFAISRWLRFGPAAPTTAPFGSRCAARSRTPRSSIACSHTNTRTRSFTLSRCATFPRG